MKDLKQDIIPCLKRFMKDIGCSPKLIRTDFDSKLVGKAIQSLFINTDTRIETAPPDEQNQNGLCERNWRSILRMARSWLISALLPSEFWWYALKRATEVSNYMPLKLNGKLTTPHELVYQHKVDLRNIFPLFSVAYPKYKSKANTDAQSCKAILVGRSDHTHNLEFYHPPTKNIITTSTYQLDESMTAGPVFNLPFDGGLFINKYCEHNEKLRPPKFTPETTVYLQNINNSYIKAEIINIPTTQEGIYTIQYDDGSIHQIHEKHLQVNDPNQDPSANDMPLNTFPSWAVNKAKCTLFLNEMNQPSQGTLNINGNSWEFRPGHKHHNTPILLPHLDRNIRHLLQSCQLFRGHLPFRKVHQLRQSIQLSKIVANHVSAKALISKDSPNLLKHCTLTQNDKDIWNKAYEEEYVGLRDLPAWVTITEKEYLMNRQTYGTLLPTMAISTIKYDENGSPKRAKYRIVALGNLDPHEWSKADCFAPVMSLMEVRFLTAIAVRSQCVLQSGDFKQAFVQSILPSNETYVLKPPPGCPLTPKHTYWLLKRSLYGLKRAPRHWYEKAKDILNKIGLHSCPNAPCVFSGTILKNKPPLYLGLYVDDFIFFSEDKQVEREFQQRLSSMTNVDFMGQVSHFLGLKFQWKQSENRLRAHISQEAFADTIIEQAGLTHLSVTAHKTPYRSGYPVDSIKEDTNLTESQKMAIQAQYRSLVGSLLWISQGTRPDLATITNMLAKHQNNPTDKHIASAKYAIKYLKGTKSRGITFDSETNDKLTSYVHFPISSSKLTGISDANWGPQDQSKPKENRKQPELELFKTRSISGHVITLHGPVHWSSKRQRITARSSCEAEIYATDECVKDILHLRNIVKDLNMTKEILHDKTTIYNDNMACVLWSKNTTTKGLRYLQIRENAIRENQHIIEIQHIAGKINPADMFSKEDKDAEHFITLRDTIVTPEFQHDVQSTDSTPTARSASTTTGNSESTCNTKAMHTIEHNVCQSNPEPKTPSLMTSLHQAGMAIQTNRHIIAPPKGTQKCNEHAQHIKHTKRVQFDLSQNMVHFIDKRNNELTFQNIP